MTVKKEEEKRFKSEGEEDNYSNIEIHCMKCKRKTHTRNIKKILEKKRLRLTGNCVNCDARKSSFVTRSRSLRIDVVLDNNENVNFSE